MWDSNDPTGKSTQKTEEPFGVIKPIPPEPPERQVVPDGYTPLAEHEDLPHQFNDPKTGLPILLGGPVDETRPCKPNSSEAFTIQLIPREQRKLEPIVEAAEAKCEIVDNTRTVQKTLLLDADAKATLWGGTMEGHTKVDLFKRTDERTIVGLLYATRKWTQSLTAAEQRSIKFREEALMKDDLDTFISRFGTGIVHSVTRQSVIAVRFTFSNFRETKRARLEQFIKGDFKAYGGSTKLQVKLQQFDNNIKFKWDVYQYGTGGKQSVVDMLTERPDNIAAVCAKMVEVVNAAEPKQSPVVGFRVLSYSKYTNANRGNDLVSQNFLQNRETRLVKARQSLQSLRRQYEALSELIRLSGSHDVGTSQAELIEVKDRIRDQHYRTKVAYQKLFDCNGAKSLNGIHVKTVDADLLKGILARTSEDLWVCPIAGSGKWTFSHTKVYAESLDGAHAKGGRHKFHACIWPDLRFPAGQLIDRVQILLTNASGTAERNDIPREVLLAALADSTFTKPYIARHTHLLSLFKKVFNPQERYDTFSNKQVAARVQENGLTWKIVVYDIEGNRHEAEIDQAASKLVYRGVGDTQSTLGYRKSIWDVNARPNYELKSLE